MAHEPLATPDQPELSIVVPALNEQESLPELVEQIERTLVHGGWQVELIVVDDGSTDRTPRLLRELAARHPWVRPLRRERSMGQSSAMFAGIQAARGKLIATLDADLQNDPAELPAMINLMRAQNADMVQGDRSASRADNAVRRVGSVVGRATRKLLLRDTIRDTGCTARVARADLARRWPLEFKGMHRFLPLWSRMHGATVLEMPVQHRQRHAGQTKYGLGVFNRGISGLLDCFALRWMLKRYRDTQVEPIEERHR